MKIKLSTLIEFDVVEFFIHVAVSLLFFSYQLFFAMAKLLDWYSTWTPLEGVCWHLLVWTECNVGIIFAYSYYHVISPELLPRLLVSVPLIVFLHALIYTGIRMNENEPIRVEPRGAP